MLGILKQYVFSGVSRHYKDETNRRIMVVNLFAAVIFIGQVCQNVAAARPQVVASGDCANT